VQQRVDLGGCHIIKNKTLSAIFDEDLTRESWRLRQRADARAMIERYLRAD
jgi:hypothetical protein